MDAKKREQEVESPSKDICNECKGTGWVMRYAQHATHPNACWACQGTELASTGSQPKGRLETTDKIKWESGAFEQYDENSLAHQEPVYAVSAWQLYNDADGSFATAMEDV